MNVCWYVSNKMFLCNALNYVDQAEIDGGRGMAVMLFHVEGNLEYLVVHQINLQM